MQAGPAGAQLGLSRPAQRGGRRLKGLRGWALSLLTSLLRRKRETRKKEKNIEKKKKKRDYLHGLIKGCTTHEK